MRVTMISRNPKTIKGIFKDLYFYANRKYQGKIHICDSVTKRVVGEFVISMAFERKDLSRNTIQFLKHKGYNNKDYIYIIKDTKVYPQPMKLIEFGIKRAFGDTKYFEGVEYEKS